MKLLICTELFPPHMGGQEVRYAELSAALARRGQHVGVATIRHAPDLPSVEQWGGRVEVMRVADAFGYRRPVRGLVARAPWGVVKYALACRRVMQSAKWDVVLTNQWPLVHVPFLRGSSSAPIVVDWCELRTGVAMSMAQRLAVRCGDWHVAVSSRVRNRLVSEYQVAAEQCLVFESGLDLQRYAKRAKGPTAPVIVCLGRLIPHKNVDWLLRAFAQSDLTGSYRVEIIGDGPSRASLGRLARQLGIAERVDFRGWVGEEEKIASLAAATLMVLASRIEGFPRVVAEAMAVGLPVITCDFPMNGAADIVREKGIGMVTAPTVDALAAALSTLATSPAARHDYGQAGLAYAPRLSWDRLAEQFETFVAGIRGERMV